jgi:protein O-GlcNAc transferase
MSLAQAVELHRQGRRADAQVLYEQALAANPHDQQCRFLLGMCLLEAGRLAEGEMRMRQVLAAVPRHGGAHHALGKLQALRGDGAAAEQCYRQALAGIAAPIDSYVELGNLLALSGKLTEAAGIYQQGLGARPRHAGLHVNLGNVLRQLGQREKAIDAWRTALRLDPQLAAAHNGIALELRAIGDSAGALRELEKAIALESGRAEYHYNLAVTHHHRRSYTGAIAGFRRTLDLAPDYRRAIVELARCYQEICAWPELDALMPRIEEEIKAATARGHTALTPFFSLSLKMSQAERTAIAGVKAREIEANALNELPTGAFRFAARASGPLRIGYLSANFRDHATSHLAGAIFGLHDRSGFTNFAYSIGLNDGSTYRRRIEVDADHFIDLATASNAEAARQIHADAIDILVDLDGFTVMARPEIAAMRPAPVQVRYLDFAGTAAAKFYDYMLVDRTVVPPETATYYSEALCYLPNCFLVTDSGQPIADVPGSRTEEGLPSASFVFCCFCTNYKIEREAFELWLRILRCVPESVLWLLGGSRDAMQRLCQFAEQQGIEAARLVFARHCRKPEHLARLALADLCLDTLTYGGHTTAVDALWAGVPMITCLGDSFAARVGASVLSAAELPELIAPHIASYEEYAVSLAQHPERLAVIRARIEERRRIMPLFDTPRWVRNLEKTYAAMWWTYLGGQSPREIAVEEGDR